MLKAAIKYHLKTNSVLALVFALMFFSCSGPASRNNVKINSKPVVVTKVLLHTPNIIHLFSEQPGQAPSSINPHTFSICKLYAATDTNSKVICMVPAMVPFTDLGTTEVSGTDTLAMKDGQPISFRMWRILYYKVKVNGHEGYLKQDDVARCVFTDTTLNTQYYMGVYFNKNADAFKFRIRKLTLANKVIADLEIDNVGESEQDVFIIKNTPLKNVSRIIKVVYHQNYCGGGETAILIADANNKLVQLPGNYTSFNDGGGVYNQTTYFAQSDSGGKIVLMPDTIGQPFETKNELAYPSQLNIPIEDLFVQTLETGQYFMNDYNEQVKLKNGRYKMETPLTLTTTYYQWNGSQAIKHPGKKVIKLPPPIN